MLGVWRVQAQERPQQAKVVALRDRYQMGEVRGMDAVQEDVTGLWLEQALLVGAGVSTGPLRRLPVGSQSACSGYSSSVRQSYNQS